MLLVQVLQWTFAAAPGHPALRDMCDHIARSVDRKFSGNKNFDTLERTGPGAFTDYILKHAQLHPLSKVGHTTPPFGQSSVRQSLPIADRQATMVARFLHSQYDMAGPMRQQHLRHC